MIDVHSKLHGAWLTISSVPTCNHQQKSPNICKQHFLWILFRSVKQNNTTPPIGGYNKYLVLSPTNQRTRVPTNFIPRFNLSASNNDIVYVKSVPTDMYLTLFEDALNMFLVPFMLDSGPKSASGVFRGVFLTFDRKYIASSMVLTWKCA